MDKNILCSISTKGRYDTTLPMCLFGIINQTKLPDHLIIFDDNDEPSDLREKELYRNIFLIMDQKGISWEVVFGEKKGQHYNHQKANKWGYEWVWRVDDDCIPSPTVLENLYKEAKMGVGCVAGSVITPQWNLTEASKKRASGKIEDVYNAFNKQWFEINEVEEVEHVHCTFLYRAGVVDFNLALSKVAHREETIFSYEMHKKGYKNLIVPNATTYHMKSTNGGIREGVFRLYSNDETIFRQVVNAGYLIVLDSGIGDHIVFESIMSEVIEKYEKVTIACCYPEVFDDWNVELISIGDAKCIIDIDQQNIYKCMADWKWEGSLENAYRKLYL